MKQNKFGGPAQTPEEAAETAAQARSERKAEGPLSGKLETAAHGQNVREQQVSYCDFCKDAIADEIQKDLDHCRIQRDELLAVAKELQGEDLSDVRVLANAILNDRHHSVTGTEAERIAYLLNWISRGVRVAQAAISKAEGNK